MKTNAGAGYLVSVVMPTWNCAKFLPDALDSVLAQDWPAMELIVVDDGSTDDTAAVLSRYGDRLRAVSIPHSGGPSRPRNLGIAASRGDLIAFFDADDVMQPGKIRRAVELFAAHPEMDLICTSFRVIGEDGQEAAADLLADYVSFRRDLLATTDPKFSLLRGDEAYGHLLRINFVGTSSVVCRRKQLVASGPFDEDLRNSGDIDLWRRLAWSGCTFGFLDEVWHSYRIRAGSICTRGSDRTPYMIRAYEKQLVCCRSDSDRRCVRRKLASLHLSHGWHLRRTGHADEAVRAYRSSLRLKPSLTGFLGLVRSRMESARRGTSGHGGRETVALRAADRGAEALTGLRNR